MAKYKVLSKMFINDALREEGDIVDYEGRAGSTLELIESKPEAKPKHKGKAEDADLV